MVFNKKDDEMWPFKKKPEKPPSMWDRFRDKLHKGGDAAGDVGKIAAAGTAVIIFAKGFISGLVETWTVLHKNKGNNA